MKCCFCDKKLANGESKGFVCICDKCLDVAKKSEARMVKKICELTKEVAVLTSAMHSDGEGQCTCDGLPHAKHCPQYKNSD